MDPVNPHHGTWIDFHHTTQKPEPLCALWPQSITIDLGLKSDPMQCGGDHPHHHLTMWATSTAHQC